MKRLFDVRRGETGRALLSFVVLMLVVGAFTIVKAVRDAIFLTRFSVTELSVIAIGLAAVMGLVVTVYLRWTAGLARDRLISGSYAVVAASLLLFWWGLSQHAAAGWLAWALYVWSSLFGVFIVMQFWLMASDLFDVREAKRLIGLVGAGAIAGGLCGGLISGLAGVIGTASLLLIAAVMLAVAAVAVKVVWRWRRGNPSSEPPELDDEEPVAGLFGLLTQHHYIRLLALLLLVATVTATLLDWQLKAVARHVYAGRTDDMAAFFGALYAALSAGSLVVQTVVTGWLLRRFGVGVGLSVLPLAIIVAAAAIIVHPLLPLTLLGVVSGAKVVEAGLRFGVDKASFELVWLPLPRRVRERGKAAVDTVVDRMGTGLAGVLWLMLVALGLDRPERLHWIALLLAALGVVWLVLLRRVRRAYVDLFRQTLAVRSLDLDNLKRSLGESEARRTLDDALHSGDEGQVRFALYLLADSDEALPDLGQVLQHSSPTVRVEALNLLRERADPSQRRAAKPSLRHSDPAVREAAVVYLRTTSPAGSDPLLDTTEQGDSSDAFAYSLIRLSAESQVVGVNADLAESIQDAEGERLLQMIGLLGAAPPDTAGELLGPLLDHDDPLVVEAALRAAGRARAETLIPRLCAFLGERRWRPRALTALTDIGSPAVIQLADWMLDATRPTPTRRSIIRLVGASREATVVPALARLLGDGDADISSQAIRALARLRLHVDVRVEPQRVLDRLDRDAIALHRGLQFLDRGPWPSARLPADEESLLQRAVREEVDRRVGQIFRLLTLIHKPADVQAVRRGLSSQARTRRSKSIEFLDNLLAPELKRTLLPAIEDAEPAAFQAASRRVVGGDDQDVLSGLLAGPRWWLRLVAVWTAGEQQRGDLRDRLVAARRDADAESRKVFDRALAKIDGDQAKESSMALTVVEKALKLQTVDVLKRASSEDLAYVAQIAEEVTLEPDVPVYRQGDAPDALYVVVSGRVRLHREGDEIGLLGPGEAFGSWALFDEAPRLATATAAEPTVLLRVERDEFLELLADRVDIVQAVFRAMVERIRSLAVLAQGS